LPYLSALENTFGI